MMIIDVIYLGLLSWYIGAIWPSEFGTHKPWWFIFDPSYYFQCFTSVFGTRAYWEEVCGNRFQKVNNAEKEFNLEMVNANGVGNRGQSPSSDGSVEVVAESLAQQRADGKCVDIQNLYKHFDTPTGKKTAVDGLTLTMYSGQITALLGHNGAGKVSIVIEVVDTCKSCIDNNCV